MKLPVTYLPNGNIQIQEYSLADYTEKLQQVAEQGYFVDFDDNASYPQQIGSIYFCICKKKEPSVEEVSQDVIANVAQQLQDSPVLESTEVQEQPEVKKAGRKPKGN